MSKGSLQMNSDSYITTKTELLDYLGEFVEVAMNMILYTREVYPATIFSRVKRFNVPVFITNYDKLYDYLKSVSEAIKPLLFQDNLKQISVTICTKEEKIALEKMSLRLSSLNPSIVESFKAKSERIDPIEKAALESIMRSFLIKLSTSDTYFKPLPSSKHQCTSRLNFYILDVTFYVIIDTNEELNPLDRELMQNDINTKFPWVLADTDAVSAFEDSSLIPLKSLESDVFKHKIFPSNLGINKAQQPPATSDKPREKKQMVVIQQSNTNKNELKQNEIDSLKLAVQNLNLGKEEGIDATQLGKLCKQTEGKIIPFDRIQAALEAVKPVKKGELSKEEFIKVIAFLRGKSIEQSNKKVSESGTKDVAPIPTPSSPSRRISEISGSVLNQSSGKKLTRLTGATESSSHSIDQEELEQFALHLNGISKNDNDLKGREEVTSENFFESCQDGLLLSKLINDSAPDTIDERVLNVGKSLNPFKMTENINVAINSAKAIGCSVVNIGPGDILEGREHLILGLVWQVIKVGLLAKISLKFHPELARLLQDGETLEEFLKLPADIILLRWFNFQLKRANVKRIVNNFGEDLVDSECYLHLLNILSPENCSKKSALCETNLEARAEAVVLNAQNIECDKYVSVGSILKANHKLNLAFVANLFNHFPGLEQLSAQEMAELDEKMFSSEGDRESRTFALWMNSLGVEPFINSLGDDLRDGRVLLQVIDYIKPGSVNWKRVHMKPATASTNILTRFQALENTNTVVDLCKNFKFSLVGIQGADVTDGVIKLTLALVWQLMRQHIIETLRGLSSANGREITDEDMINWSNEMIKKHRPTSRVDPIKSFKDSSLKSGRYLLELLAAVNPSIVNFELVTPGKTEEDAKSNGKYAISVARKMGASIFLLPEDIFNVQPRMLLTFIGTIMAIHFENNNE